MKKLAITLIMAALVLVLAPAVSAAEAPSEVTATASSEWGYDASDIKGDANDDWEVDVKDLVRVKKYLAFKGGANEPEINVANASYGEGEINGDDLAALRRQLLSM